MSNGSGPWGGQGGGGGRGNGSGKGPWGGQGSNGGGNGQRPSRPEQPSRPSGDNISDFQERMRRMSNGGSGGGGPRRGPSRGNGGGGDLINAANIARYLPIIIVVAIVGWLATGIKQVAANEQGVVETFGSFSRVVGPGLMYHWPSPIESLQTVNTTTPNETTIGHGNSSNFANEAESLMLTSDQNIVDVQLTIRWLVSDPRAYLYAVESQRDQSEIFRTVKTAGEAALRSVIGVTTLDGVLAQGKAIVESSVRDELQAILNSYGAVDGQEGIGMGIEVDNVLLVNAQPPAPVREAFDDVNNARQEFEQLQNQALTYQNSEIPRANGEAFQTIESAEAYKSEQESLAIGERDRFLATLQAYEQTPDVTVQRLYIETMERILNRRGATILDGSLGEGALPLLNLGAPPSN